MNETKELLCTGCKTNLLKTGITRVEDVDGRFTRETQYRYCSPDDSIQHIETKVTEYEDEDVNNDVLQCSACGKELTTEQEDFITERFE